MTMCKIHIHILSTHGVLLDIVTVNNIHYTPYVLIPHYVHMYTHSNARPDFAELDVFLGQHILLTLEQHFNPKI